MMEYGATRKGLWGCFGLGSSKCRGTKRASWSRFSCMLSMLGRCSCHCCSIATEITAVCARRFWMWRIRCGGKALNEVPGLNFLLFAWNTTGIASLFWFAGKSNWSRRMRAATSWLAARLSAVPYLPSARVRSGRESVRCVSAISSAPLVRLFL